MATNLSFQFYNHELHSYYYRQLLASRSIDAAGLGSFLPPTGYIVFYGDVPAAIGFMIKCDNGMAINSDLISNPDVPQPMCADAVDFVRQLLAEEAEASGLRFITAFTKHKRLAERLIGKGFAKIDENLIQVGRFLWL